MARCKPIFLLSNCSAGFLRNDNTGECEDIDECEGSDITCDFETQVCSNTPGSYKCLDVIPNTNPLPTCPNGYQFNSKTKQCDGETFAFQIIRRGITMGFLFLCLFQISTSAKRASPKYHAEADSFASTHLADIIVWTCEQLRASKFRDSESDNAGSIESNLFNNTIIRFICIKTDGTFDCEPEEKTNLHKGIQTIF